MDRLKFEVGLTVQSGVQAFCRFVDKWRDHIGEIYYSPIYDTRYVSRSKTAETKPEDLQETLEYLRRAGIPLNLCLNTSQLAEADVARPLEEFAGYFDRITAMHHLADQIREMTDVPLTYSYSNNHRTMHDIRKIPRTFDQVVVATGYFREPQLLADIERRGFRPVILLNNGCSDRCLGCLPGECARDFKLHSASGTIDEIYATRSIMPWELHEHILKFPTDVKFKLSTRASSARYLDLLLDSYTNNKNEADLGIPASDTSQLWARLGQFSGHWKTINFSDVNNIKKAIWNTKGDTQWQDPHHQ
jgi:hypothetical protein